MNTDRKRIGERARKERNLVFTSLYHHVTDVDNLRACYVALDGSKAVGVDGVTKEEYGRNQHGCLDELGRTIQQKKVSHVVEADITGFFNNVNHEWMIKFLEHRIGDPSDHQADKAHAERRDNGGRARPRQ